MPTDPVDPSAAPDLPAPPDPRYRAYWPITTLFREKIADAESRGSGGYRARNGGALGAYQLTPIALEDIHWRDKQGRWTPRSGVTNDQEFLNSPLAQETALKEYLFKNRQYARTEGLLGLVGQTIRGADGDFTVTDNGLAAAMHREGAPTVKAYLDFLQNRGWVSNESSFPEDYLKKFRHIESRLQDFADVPYLHLYEH